MTPEELLNAYKDAYKKTAADPATMRKPAVVNVGNPPAKPAGLWDAINLRRKPLPAAPNPKFVESPLLQTAGGGPVAQNTWQPPTAYQLIGGYADRNARRNDAIESLNSNLANRVSPTIWDSYKKDGTKLNMSREAMVRRMNMLQRQKALDERMRRAGGMAPGTEQ